MVQNDSWEWLLTGFKIDLETQVKPKTVKAKANVSDSRYAHLILAYS